MFLIDVVADFLAQKLTKSVVPTSSNKRFLRTRKSTKITFAANQFFENRALARWQVSRVGSWQSEFDPWIDTRDFSPGPAPKRSGVGENPQVKKKKCHP
jgi:hypothetical protein